MKWDSRVLGSFWNFGACNESTQELQRSHHAATIVDDKFMYIYGGIIKDDRNVETPTDTLVRYNIETGDYVTLKCKTKSGENGIAPPPLSHHTLSLIEFTNGKRFLYVFGGRKKDQKASGELYSFDLDTEQWCRVRPHDGKIALPRFSHSATVVDGTKLYVIGGTTDQGKYISDVFIFDAETQVWQRVKTNGAQPAARSGHTAVQFGSSVYIFGGGNDSSLFNDLNALDIDTMTWTPIIVKTSVMPMKRTYHTATCVGNKMIVFGGVGKTYTNDIMIFDFEKRVWVSEESLEKKPKHPQKFKPEPFRPPCLYGHSAVQSGPKLWVFGGKCDDKLSSNTLYTLETGFKGVQPIDLGRCTLQSDLCTVVNDQMTSDVIVNVCDVEYNCHRAVFRVRCPPLHKECVKNTNDYIHLQDVIQRLAIRNSAILDDKEKQCLKDIFAIQFPTINKQGNRTNNLQQQKQHCKITQECFLAFLHFIYSDTVNEIEQLGEQNLLHLKLLAKLFNLNRLYNLALAADQSNQEITIPPPTLLADFRKLFDLTTKATQAIYNVSMSAAAFASPISATSSTALSSIFLGNKSTPSQILLQQHNFNFLHANDNESCEDIDDSQSQQHDEIIDQAQETHGSTNDDEMDRMSMASANSSSFLSVQINSNPKQYTYCDVTFVVDTECMCAHKFVLSARSAFFEGLLSAQQQEAIEEDGLSATSNNSGGRSNSHYSSFSNIEVNVENVTPHVFKLILEYLYTGHCHITADNALELLVAAVNFELERLANMCQSVIERKLHVHNVCKIFSIADSCDAEHLRQACVYYMVHHLSQVKKTHSYKIELPREVKHELRTLRREMKHQDNGVIGDINLDDLHYAPYSKDNRHKSKSKKNKTMSAGTPVGSSSKKKKSQRATSPSIPFQAAKRLERTNYSNNNFSRKNDSDDEIYKFATGIDDDMYANSPPDTMHSFMSKSPTFVADYYKQLLEIERQNEMAKHVAMRKKNNGKQPRRKKAMIADDNDMDDSLAAAAGSSSNLIV